MNRRTNFFSCFCLWAGLVLGSGLVPLRAQEAVVDESVADQRLIEILASERDLVAAAVQGVGQDGLLVRAQDIARSYESFLADNPDHLYGWILCGKFLRSVGADNKAFAAFRKANSLQPDLPVVQQQMGLVLADLGSYEAALPFLLRAVELDPEEPGYHDEIGIFLIKYGSQLEVDGVLGEGRASALALESFETAFRLDPDSFERGWRWAEAHADLAEPDWEATAMAWQRVLPLAQTVPEREASRLQISRGWIEAGKPERAEEWLEPVETEALQASWEQLRAMVSKDPGDIAPQTSSDSG
ncbi:tetratricopeptide repeat protein [Puniceicoccus vermicola]|uniref:Tetratricopeptide repeat protein n=1 Tax=Puniceicoccus vermicola TaxID=388746 RepID=A0A7X1AVF9_9BACT|nr:tetratricopeptide repeat protein [Puniceicoccus vermicola]MBC2600721.1 tetratricopeptide repeat protein [Puniceicoccus vermicola]